MFRQDVHVVFVTVFGDVQGRCRGRLKRLIALEYSSACWFGPGLAGSAVLLVASYIMERECSAKGKLA